MLIHGSLKQMQFCVDLITPWSQNEILQICQISKSLVYAYISCITSVCIWGKIMEICKMFTSFSSKNCHNYLVSTERVLSQVLAVETGFLRKGDTW